jgi:hypothetical protein
MGFLKERHAKAASSKGKGPKSKKGNSREEMAQTGGFRQATAEMGLRGRSPQNTPCLHP